MIKFNNWLDEPCSEKQMDYIKDLLAQHIKEWSNREPTAQGQAFIDAMVLPNRQLTKFEASGVITALKSSPIAYFKYEFERKRDGKKLTSESHGAALRSVFPKAYQVLYPESK